MRAKTVEPKAYAKKGPRLVCLRPRTVLGEFTQHGVDADGHDVADQRPRPSLCRRCWSKCSGMVLRARIESGSVSSRLLKSPLHALVVRPSEVCRAS